MLVQLVPNLSPRADDDPRAFLERGYTWQGQRSVNGRLAAVYADRHRRHGRRSPRRTSCCCSTRHGCPTRAFDVTITLADHGPRTITLPDDAETALVADYPQIAGELGF